MIQTAETDLHLTDAYFLVPKFSMMLGPRYILCICALLTHYPMIVEPTNIVLDREKLDAVGQVHHMHVQISSIKNLEGSTPSLPHYVPYSKTQSSTKSYRCLLASSQKALVDRKGGLSGLVT